MSDPVRPGRHGATGGSDPARPAGNPAVAEAARRHVRFRAVNLLLLVPLIGVLIPEFYNRTSPRWGGMPFFYWYQLVWIPVSVLFTYAVYRATRGER